MQLFLLIIINLGVKNLSALVSIVIPVYNAVPYLESCLKSVSSQSYQFIEVIIINDGSTDCSEEVIREYIKEDVRFKLFSQENHGLGYTRNKGITLSNGRYIFFLDSDDLIPVQAIQSLVTAVEKNDADYAVGKVIRFNQERKYIPIRHLEFDLYNKNTLTTIFKNPEMLQDSIACNKLWRRELLVENGLLFKEGKYYEDLSLTMKAAILAKKIEVINEVVYHWRIRDDENKPSITQQQMKLENTLDRVEALSESRHWLIITNIEKRVIEEHDLKSLLDVLRLHVSQYSLIKGEERDQWQRSVISFLKIIPLNVVHKLPEKERELYDLIMNNNYLDLMLFSQMLTNTETSPIVIQEEENFILKGIDNTYEVAQYLKPTVIVKEIKKIGAHWRLSGELSTPKSTYKNEGKIFVVGRKDKEVIYLEDMELTSTNENTCYPFEKQLFSINLNPNQFLKNKKESTYDFHFCLENYPKYNTARVRLYSSIETNHNIKKDGINLSLYRTNYGNLSINVRKYQVIKLILKKFMALIKR